MENLKVAAWMVRYGARSLAYNLGFIPADRLDWAPEPGAKSALQIAQEVVGGMRMYLPILRGGEWDNQTQYPPVPTLAVAQDLLAQTAEEYAAAQQHSKPERRVQVARWQLDHFQADSRNQEYGGEQRDERRPVQQNISQYGGGQGPGVRRKQSQLRA